MSLNLSGYATLSSLTLSRPGGDDSGDTLATLKLTIPTSNTDAVCAALGIESGDKLEWAWLKSEDSQSSERRYIRMGAIACDGAKWVSKHLAGIAGYRNLRPKKVVVESVRPVLDGVWELAVKVQVEHPPAGAVECWAQFIGSQIRVELWQDGDLLEPSDSLTEAARELGEKMARSGTTVTLTTRSGSVTVGAK